MEGALDYNMVSIVIPVYNEEESVPLLYKSIKKVMDATGLNYEIIFVDDGSKDNTFSILSDIQKSDPNVVAISFRRNFGQTAAMAAGFDHASGDIIVTMDADLQNDPKDIPRLVEKAKDYDVVSGWGENGQAPVFFQKASVHDSQLADLKGYRGLSA